MRLLKLLLVLFACAATPASAGPLEDGRAAYDRGDYATALRLWAPLADQGSPSAQYNLGGMYASSRGVSQGVPHDLVQAYKWLSLAASRARGNDLREAAIKARDLVASGMTPARIAEAAARTGAATACVVRGLGDDPRATLPAWQAAWQQGLAGERLPCPDLPHPTLAPFA